MTEVPISLGLLRWRCRRGTKELDRILGGYLEENYAQANAQLRRAFVALLEEQDPDIYDWLMGAQEPDKEQFKGIITALQQKYQI